MTPLPLIATIVRVAEVAQVVEQRTENPRVPSSILGLGTIKYSSGSSSAVERLLAKEEVASSNLVFRSSLVTALLDPGFSSLRYPLPLSREGEHGDEFWQYAYFARDSVTC